MTDDPCIAIVEALGLDPDTIRKDGVTIQVKGIDEPTIVTVHFLAHKLPPLAPTLRRYKLVLIDEDERP
jgi:hypothetical protein